MLETRRKQFLMNQKLSLWLTFMLCLGCISMRACKIDIKSSVSKEASQLCANCEKMIDALFPAVMAVIRIREGETAMAVVPFLSAYILRIKHFQERLDSFLAASLQVLFCQRENTSREGAGGGTANPWRCSSCCTLSIAIRHPCWFIYF